MEDIHYVTMMYVSSTIKNQHSWNDNIRQH